MKHKVDYKALNECRLQEMKQVDLADFLIQNFGYRLISGKKSGKSERVIEGPAGKLHIFWDKKNNTGWMFKNWHSGETGQIVQYLRKHEGFERPTVRETMEHVYQFVSERAGILNNDLRFVYTDTTPKVESRAFNPEFDDRGGFEYLKSRGLNETTLLHPVFADVVKNILYKPTEYSKGIGFYNTAYLIRDSIGKIVSIEMINCKSSQNRREVQSFRTQPSGVSCGNGIIHSKLPYENSSPAKVSGIIIGEAFTDVLSFAQMRIKPQAFEKYIFIGTYGSLGDSQIQHVQKLINEHKPDFICLANDADVAGFSYDLRLIGGLRPPGGKSIWLANYTHNKEAGRLTIRLSDSVKDMVEADNFGELANLLQSWIEGKNFLQPGGSIYDQGSAGQSRYYMLKDNGNIEVLLEHTKNDISEICDVINKLYNKNRFFHSFKANGKSDTGQEVKDFNEQLMLILGLKKENIKPNRNPYMNVGMRQNVNHTNPGDFKMTAGTGNDIEMD